MKLLSRIVVCGLLFGLMIGPEPKEGLCPMAQKIRAESCPMPCCPKAPAADTTCPMLRQAQDTIASAPVRMVEDLRVSALPVVQIHVSAPRPHVVRHLAQTVPRRDPCRTPQSIPAPPVIA